MSTVAKITGDLRVSGDLTVDGSIPTVERTDIAQEANAIFPVPWTAWRVHDSPTLTAGDLKASGATTRYARCQVALPAEYDAAETVTLRISAGMVTTVADDSATVDVQCYKADREGAVGSDICNTAAQSINSETFANKDFTITPTGLTAGDVLDIRIAVTVTDAATATAVTATIGAVELLCDIRG